MPEFHPDHPLGCHRRRIDDRIVFEHIVAALVHGSGYECIATVACSDRTIRRRLAQWAAAGLGAKIHALALRAYDAIIGLQLGDVLVDGCITKAPCGGDKAGPSPVDRRKGGLKRSTATDGYGIPIGLASAGANRHDLRLLAPTLASAFDHIEHWPDDISVHLDAAYNAASTRQLLDDLHITAAIAQTGTPTPVHATKRWRVERTNSWTNNFGKLRRMTDRNGLIVNFYLHLAATFVTVRQLIHRAKNRYRWPTRPTTRRLK